MYRSVCDFQFRTDNVEMNTSADFRLGRNLTSEKKAQ